MCTHLRSAIFGLGALACGIAHANLIANGSFEFGSFAPPSNQTMTLSPGSNGLAGWQVVNDSLAWISVGDPWGLDAQDGDRFLDLSDYSVGPPFGGVQQSLPTNPGYEYSVSFYLGSSNLWGRPAALTVSAAGQSAIFESPTTGTNNDWQQRSFQFVAISSSTTLSFVGASGVNYIGLDNVVVTVTAVPEPTTTVFLLAGLAALSLRMSRRHRDELV